MAAKRSVKKPASKPVVARPTRAEPPDTDVLPLVVWAARLSAYFLLQGGIVLLAYAYYGFHTDPHKFAIGFRLDPIQAGMDFAWGLVGTYIGFFRPRYATPFALAFAAFYTVIAFFGTLTPYHLGMKLDADTNLFHWLVALAAWGVGLNGLRQERGA
jgi:hypothetical protein